MLSEYPLLSRINNPNDIKDLSSKQLILLSGEIRKYIINVVSENGGHLASNLGVVELTLALHYIFNSPKDKIIWDVGHQCYTHKLITGRKNDFISLRKKDGLSGFPKQSESPHDIVMTGHASTSISAAIGILMGQQLQGDNSKVIAVIGDGALTGGLALEGLNFVGHSGKELIIILNDNKMSINKNVGALSYYFSKITATSFYQYVQRNFDATVQKIPVIGKSIFRFIFRFKKGLKG